MTELFYSISYLIIAVTAAIVFGKIAAKAYKGNSKKAIAAFTVITAAAYFMLYFFYGASEKTLKGIIFCLILLFASYEDIKIRQVENYIHIMIVITAFIGREFTEVLYMLIPALIMSLIFLAVVLICKNFKMGGADIKLSVACAFMLGQRSLYGLIIGLIAAIIINTIKKTGKQAFPLIPYLAVGFMTAYFI